jgi:hypothetical protein
MSNPNIFGDLKFFNLRFFLVRRNPHNKILLLFVESKQRLESFNILIFIRHIKEYIYITCPYDLNMFKDARESLKFLSMSVCQESTTKISEIRESKIEISM